MESKTLGMESFTSQDWERLGFKQEQEVETAPIVGDLGCFDTHPTHLTQAPKSVPEPYREQVVCTKATTVNQPYGLLYCWEFKTNKGDLLVYRTTRSLDIIQGTRYQIYAELKELKLFNGIEQHVLKNFEVVYQVD